MDRERRNSSIHGNPGEFLFSNHRDSMDHWSINNRENNGTTCNDNNYDGDWNSSLTNQLIPVSSSSPSASTSSLSGYIQHPVSKFDTLAGVAIRYGVEVADIKRLNGLVTDIQMFALKSLHIPRPGRHPPATCLSNGLDDMGESSSEGTSLHLVNGYLFDSFQSLRPRSSQQKVSSAMSSLQGYYGLEPKYQRTESEVLEMEIFQKGGSRNLEDRVFIRTNPAINRPLSRHRKSKSLVIDFLDEKGDDADLTPRAVETSDRWVDKLLRRRQSSESNFMAMTPEMVLKEDSGGGGGGGGSGGFSATAGKRLALRSKATIRTSLLPDADMSPTVLGDHNSSSLSSVRKSSSTSSLQDQETSGLSSIWPASKWNLKHDMPLLSSAAITRPIFDGLPKPLTSRRNKTALD